MDIWRFVDQGLHVPYNLYTLVDACGDSVTELNQLYDDYMLFFENGDAVSFNLFYNGGYLLKGVSNIIMYFIALEYTRVKTPFDMGMELGQIFWMLFYPAQKYLDNAIEEGYDWGRDYTWDQIISAAIPDDEAVAPVDITVD